MEFSKTFLKNNLPESSRLLLVVEWKILKAWEKVRHHNIFPHTIDAKSDKPNTFLKVLEAILLTENCTAVAVEEPHHIA